MVRLNILYNKGEIMFWQTEFGEHYYIVVEGGVGIYAKQERGAAAKLAQHTEQLKKDGHASTDWSVPVLRIAFLYFVKLVRRPSMEVLVRILKVVE